MKVPFRFYENLPEDVDKDLLYLIGRITKMFPIYIKMKDTENDIKSDIHQIFMNYYGPIIGFYFNNYQKNSYSYDMIFNHLTINTNSEIWKQ